MKMHPLILAAFFVMVLVGLPPSRHSAGANSPASSPAISKATPIPVTIKVPWDAKSLASPLPDNDPDYNSFYRQVPKAEFPALRESLNPGRKRSGPFVFQKIDYPTGEKNPTTYRFDMGPKGSLVEKGYALVTRDDKFTWEKGWGWEGAPAADFEYAGPDSVSIRKRADFETLQAGQVTKAFAKQGKQADENGPNQFPNADPLCGYFLDDLSRDAVLNPDELVFKVALPNGRYQVSMIVGDVQLPRYGVDVYANGDLVASDLYSLEMPWPTRVTFSLNVSRNNLRIALKADNARFEEQAEVSAATPDYDASRLPYAIWRLTPGWRNFFGKRMELQGPVTQMAIAGMTIAPYAPPPLELVRQQIRLAPGINDKNAAPGASLFNAGDRKGAEKSFEKISASDYLLQASAYLALAGHLETEVDEEIRLADAATKILETGVSSNPDDLAARDLLRSIKMYRGGLAFYARLYMPFLRAGGLPEEAPPSQDSQAAAGRRRKESALFTWMRPGDILYSKALMRYGRLLAAGEPHRLGASWQAAEAAFIKLQDQEPGNRFSNYFLYWDPAGWDVPDYTKYFAMNAPQWAVLIHEAYNRLLDQADWWHDNRMRPDGSIGGGWGDDVECNQDWEVMALINPDADPKATDLARAIAEGVWWSGEVDRDAGFYDGLADNEHVAEWTGDTQPYLLAMDYGNPLYFERNLKAGKLMRDVWMAKTPRGHLHFKSMIFGNKAVGADVDEALDCPLNGRATGSASWAWWYSPLDGLESLFGQWAEAWYEDAMREENGKPKGVIPGNIGFIKDELGGNGATDWRQLENPDYLPYILGLFSHMYSNTGDARWLEPKAMRFSEKGLPLNEFDPVLVAAEGAEIADKYTLLKDVELERIVQYMRITWPSVTSENSCTDRIGMPGLNQVYKLLMGGDIQYQGLDTVPMTLEKTSRRVAFLNLASAQKYAKTIFYNFSDKPEPVNLRLWKLQVGAEHEVVIGEDKDDDDKIDQVLQTVRYTHAHRGDSIAFTLPPGKAIVVEVKQTKAGEGMPRRAVDLGLAAEDIDYREGKLFVTVHNIGNEKCGSFDVKVWQGEANKGKLLQTFSIDGLEAPNDLEPRTVTRSLDWSLPKGVSEKNPVEITVELDSAEKYYEITEHNNVKSRAFPSERKSYQTPRMWKSLAQPLGLKDHEPFPADFPKEQIR